MAAAVLSKVFFPSRALGASFKISDAFYCLVFWSNCEYLSKIEFIILFILVILWISIQGYTFIILYVHILVLLWTSIQDRLLLYDYTGLTVNIYPRRPFRKTVSTPIGTNLKFCNGFFNYMLMLTVGKTFLNKLYLAIKRNFVVKVKKGQRDSFPDAVPAAATSWKQLHNSFYNTVQYNSTLVDFYHSWATSCL